MEERGFWHPDRGYWQAIAPPCSDARRSYPDGTVEVPLRPSPAHAWDGQAWQPPDP